MSFSPTATRRNVYPHYPATRRDFSPTRRDLSPNGNRELSPPPTNYNYYNDRSTSPPQPNARPKKDVNNTDNNTEVLKPLLEPDANQPLPPLAGPEIDDLDSDDRETVHNNQPGVDDGFFSGGSNGDKGVEDNNPDSEALPEKPKEPEPFGPPNEFPDEIDIGTRAGSPIPRYPEFPYAPGYGPGVINIPDYAPTEFGGETIPDVNFYQHKKTLAQGMMDLALFSANANQLRYVIESYNRHPYYYISIILISFSLAFQIAVGVGLIWNARYNVKEKKEMCIANKINNFTVIGIFLVTVINVFISAFGVANAPVVSSSGSV